MVKYRVSIDIGGTFTDLVALNEEDGEVLNIKVPSTPKEPARAVIRTFQEFLRKTSEAEVLVVIHATTIATNALLGQLNIELPTAALIATKGFRDIIEIGRQRRHQLYNLFIQKPRTLIPRRLRFEVEERTGSKGEILMPLNKDQVKRLVQQLEGENVKTVAVALLFSYINQLHESEIGRILKKSLPKIFVSLSSETAPEYREYERTSTAVVNAVLMPIVSNYLNDLQTNIRKLGVKAPLCIMQSDGGIATKSTVSRKPVGMVESGPAAGVIASAFYGNLLGIENILSFDMGGTTAKAGAIKKTTPEVVSEYEVAGKVHSGRIVKGSGYPVRYPFIDLAECSAGGGTIAWVDEGKAIQVGPISAGAEPGPACYGMGGKQPTVTDANIVLGRLNPKYVLGGEMRIYPKLSEKAILENICEKTQIGLTEAAAGIIKITNSAMAKILRIVSVERGHDPRTFVLMCFGGAGPMHGCALAEELGIGEIVVPCNPGLFSAYGLLAADFRNSFVKPIMKLMDEVEVKKVENAVRKLEFKGLKLLERQRVQKVNMRFIRQVDLRYFGQSYELTIPVSTPFNKEALYQTVENFHKKHQAVYGYAVKDEPVELVNVRLVAVGLVQKPNLKERPLHREEPLKETVIAEREVFFKQDNDYIQTPIYRREKLKAVNMINGPAVIEQYDATTVVYPNWTASIDNFGNIVLSIKKGEN
ncbi:MAG: hydantoinase/oxoprolinase family protein [Candidatus Bathyarchaeota archaeon]|nr:hydantoinase/oxoprolinase family protein [Candidatus Bathyarchaeota archaeon]